MDKNKYYAGDVVVSHHDSMANITPGKEYTVVSTKYYDDDQAVIFVDDSGRLMPHIACAFGLVEHRPVEQRRKSFWQMVREFVTGEWL